MGEKSTEHQKMLLFKQTTKLVTSLTKISNEMLDILVVVVRPAIIRELSKP